jgi:hypothetical protein
MNTDANAKRDKVEFALRDAGFDYDDAARIAMLAHPIVSTNAGPVLPELTYMLGLLTTGQHERIHEWGRQCWNACAEHVAGPLRQALSECATAVGAGAAPDCSVEFLRQVPREVELVVARLRERVAELERLVELYRVQWVERDNCAWLAMQAECEARGAELDRLRAENESLRDLLCSAHAGMRAYRDDGEMQDNTAHPSIDFKRDAPEQIRAALQRRSDAARAELEREWMKHPQTIEAKAQWDAVASALGADKNCPDSVLSAAHRLRAENEALRADAERARWVIANAEWHRSEDRTYMAILVPRGSDLSCVAFRRDAIDAARAAREGK